MKEYIITLAIFAALFAVALIAIRVLRRKYDEDDAKLEAILKAEEVCEKLLQQVALALFTEAERKYGSGTGQLKFSTVMAQFLHKVQQAGIKTSIDVVSDSTVDFGKTIIPALKYCNYAIMNEIECCSIWQQDAYDTEGNLSFDNIRTCMERMLKCGVKDKVIVHSKTCSFALDAQTGEFTKVPSLKIPQEIIKGSVGAGDAFCAGCLYGIYNNYSNPQILEFASAAAACSLFAANYTDGMRSKADIFKVAQKYEKQMLL